MQTFYFSFCALWAVSGYIYTGQASMDMDICMDIHAKSVDMDRKFQGNPEYFNPFWPERFY